MNAECQRAYRLILAAGLLHVKWDLACLYSGFSWLPWRRAYQMANSRRAAYRAGAFHNLAIFVAQDFDGFSEEKFWDEIRYFQQKFPFSDYGNYREMFEASMRGDEVSITAPMGNISPVA